MGVLGKRLVLSQLLQPEDLGACLGISAQPRVMLPPLARHWCKAQLSMPRFPWQEGLWHCCPPYRFLGCPCRGPHPWRREGESSGAVHSWASLLPKLGPPAWAVTSWGSVCTCGGNRGCAAV